MSDIQYDTRTGAVMAGGLTGSGHRAGAAMKKILSHLRDICPEARSRSNQELVLLLENYDDQVVAVADALKTGEANAILGGWATTTKKGKIGGKGKKNSESDAGNENVSVSSNSSKIPAALAQQKSNGNLEEPSSKAQRPLDSIGTIKPQQPIEPKIDNEKKILVERLEVKEIPAPDIHTYLATFPRLQIQLNETLVEDMKTVELAFEQARRAIDHRQEALRRNLLRQKEEADQTLERRLYQARQLTDRITQSNALSTKELDEYRQLVSTFTTDYKFDLHLASAARFSYLLEPLQKEINKFGNVAQFSPSYAYIPPARHIAIIAPHSQSSKPVHLSSSSHQVVGSSESSKNPVRSNHAASDHSSRSHGILSTDQHPQVSQQKPTEKREKITIVPKDAPGAAPLNSLVISGGNLSPEELAALTNSLNLSYQAPKPKSSFENGNFSESDIFSGGAVWTNSNGSFEAGQWNAENSPTATTVRPVDEHAERNHNAPRRGGPGYRGAKRGNNRGQINGRGGGVRGPHAGRGGRGQ